MTLSSPAPQERCRTTYTRGLTTTQRKQVLDYHNKLRSAVAGGRWGSVVMMTR